MLYAFAASEDYDPAPDLEKIEAPLLAINSADDLVNPPRIGHHGGGDEAGQARNLCIAAD